MYEVPISSTPPPRHSQFLGRNKDVARVFLRMLKSIFYKTLEVGVMSDGSWPNRTTTIIYNVIKALIMHNTERLDLPMTTAQCL